MIRGDDWLSEPLLQLVEAARIRPFQRGKYGKGLVGTDGRMGMMWRTKGWTGNPKHEDVLDGLGIRDPTVSFHVDKQGRFFFQHADDDTDPPTRPQKLAAQIAQRDSYLMWGGRSAEQHERSGAEG